MIRRWPVLLLILALVGTAVALDQRDSARSRREALATGAAEGAADVARLVPTAAPGSSLDSAWYCAAGGGAEDGPVRSVLVLSNPTDHDRTAHIVAVPAEGEEQQRDVALPAWSRVDLALSELTAAEWASAMVQVDGGGVVVERRVSGPTGTDVAPCTTEASTRWLAASGATTRDATETLVVFNPFPEPAVVDLRFPTDDGVRVPELLQGLPVDGRSTRVIDVTAQVTVRSQVAAEVTTRTGRIVVDRVQTYDGTGAATTEEGAAEEAFRPKGLTVAPLVPRPQPRWSIPLGQKREGLREQVVVFNPTEKLAQVEVAVTVEDPERNGEVDPFGLEVPAQSARVLDLDAQERLPGDLSHALEVTSINGVPVVADRLLASADPYGAIDTAVGSGSPVAGPRWVVGSVRIASGRDTRVVVANPGTTTVTVRLVGFAGGDRSPLGEEVRIAGGGHRVLSLGAVLQEDGGRALLVEASGPVVVEGWLVAQGEGFGASLAVPMPEGLVRLP